MRMVLVDLKSTDALMSKDTVAGGYGSRMAPFSLCTKVYCFFKKRFHDLASMQLGYAAAIAASHGNEVVYTQGEHQPGDVALVLSSLVDYRNEVAWAETARSRGLRVGFIGLAASKLPELFAEHGDFVITGEPESAIERLARGETLSGLCASEAVADLDSLPFPRWDLLSRERAVRRFHIGTRPLGGGFPLLASRSCPEFCTYCPHRILASFRARSVANIIAEIEQLCELSPRPYVVFRDPMFTENRDRCLELCDEIAARGLSVRFECETRLDHLDGDLLDKMAAAGLRVITFGVESIADDTLRKVGRRPTPQAHQRFIVDRCRELGVTTAAYYVFGFLADTWNSVAATIDYSISLGTTFAQFKLLTPYPATPLWKQMQPLVYEQDWEKFDGYTPTFRHPNLSAAELRFLLGAAYARFYGRPSWLPNYFRIGNETVCKMVRRMDVRALEAHSRKEQEIMLRPVTC